MSTPNLAIPHILQSQAQKEVTANAAFDRLDEALNDRFTIDVSAGNTTVAAEDWGAQFEVGGHASSYIATTGSAATREADTLTIPLTAFPYKTREGTLFAEVSLNSLPASSAADNRQHVAHLYGADNESRWFFREDGLVFLGRRDGGTFSSHDNRLIIPGFAPRTVYRCAVAITPDDFVIAVSAVLLPPAQARPDRRE